MRTFQLVLRLLLVGAIGALPACSGADPSAAVATTAVDEAAASAAALQEATAPTPVAAPAPAAELPAARKRNVFLITIDTLRADHLGVYGYRRATSPQIDRFARANVLFQHAVAQWPKTSPSFASMLTGLHPQTTGLARICPLQVGEELQLVAERFRSAGWKTLAVVSNPNLDAQFGFAQGFDDYNEGWKPEQKVRIDTRGELPGPATYARFVNAHAFSALDRAGTTEGLFAWIHYTDPHAPYRPPEVYSGRFVGDEWYDAKRTVELNGDEVGEPYLRGIPPYARLDGPRERELDFYVAEYDAAIYTTDEQVGVLLDELERRKLLDDALVILTSDHGESIGEHDYFCEHGLFPYEDCTRVPLVVALPGTTGPLTIDAPIGLVDLVPTMLSFAGLPIDAELPGQDLLPVIRGEAEPLDFAISGAGYADHYQQVVRAGRWKLVYVPTVGDRQRMTGEEWELYDVEADPAELKNVAKERPEVTESLRRKLLEWLAKHHREGAGKGGQVEALDPRTEEMMRKLGYIK